MRVIMAASRFPYPPRGGDTSVCFNRIRTLSRTHEIVFVCLSDRPVSAHHRNELEKYCEIHVVVKSPIESLTDVALRSIFTKDPLQLVYYHTRQLKRLIRELHSRRPFELAHIFMLRALPLVRDLSIPCVMDVNDAQTLAIGHRRARARGFMRAAWDLELRRVRVLEQNLSSRNGRVIVMSDRDVACFKDGVAEKIPLGVAVGDYRDNKNSGPLAVFSGGMGYYPNVEAALFFVDHCWTEVRRTVPTARFQIIGRRPPKEVLRLHGLDGIEVVGRVPDMGAALAPAWVSVAPMTVAWGMHTKILEAMAAGVPVVATRAAGDVFQAGCEHGLFIADTAPEIARTVGDLLSDRGLAVSLGKRALSYAGQRHSWSIGTRRIEEVYVELMQAKPPDTQAADA